MTVSIEKTEHYVLFRPEEDSISSEDVLNLCELAHTHLNQNDIKYIILDLNGAATIPESCIISMQMLHEDLQNKGGLCIGIHGDPHMMQFFDENQLLLVPSENEAIEYILMDQLEKQFLTDTKEGE